NADPVYVLTSPRVDGALVHADGGVTVELAATRPCWRGRDVRYLAALRPIPRPRGAFVRGTLYESAGGRLWVLRM
ncbi:MAG: hypothetical protein ACLGHP_07560, partial [Vicinamibacteria bacterium]